jgi:hypothetical protein
MQKLKTLINIPQNQTLKTIYQAKMDSVRTHFILNATVF